MKKAFWFSALALFPCLFLGAGCGAKSSPASPSTPTPQPTAPPFKVKWQSAYLPFGLALSGATLYSAENYGGTTNKLELFNISSLTSGSTPFATWTAYGSTPFADIYGVAANPGTGVVYVTDLNHGVYAYDSNGATVISWDSYQGTAFAGGYNMPIAISPSGNLYVGDTGHNLIDEFNPTGGAVTQWAGDGSALAIAVSPLPPYNVYATNNVTNTVHEYTAGGASITKWGGAATLAGVGEGLFAYPGGIAVGPDGNVYVSDGESGPPSFSNDDFVQEFSPSGTFLLQWGGTGTGNSQFTGPAGIVVGSSGDVFVGDALNTIREFRP